MTEFMKILLVFFVVVAANRALKNLPAAVLLAAISAAVLYNLEPARAAIVAAGALVSPMTATTLLSFYCVTFLQRMMESRGRLDLAQQALSGLFNNRRVNASLAPVLVGMLPSAGAVTISGAIVDKTAGNHLSTEEKTFVASFYRHIPEAILPTYSTILIGVQLAGQSMSLYLLLTLPLVLLLAGLGYAFHLRKIPKETGLSPSRDKRKDALDLFRSFWTILLTVSLIITLRLPVYAAVAAAVVLNIGISRFRPQELLHMLVTAFDLRLVLTTLSIMVFKDVIIETGVLHTLPAILSALPIPVFLVFFLIFFCGAIVSGQSSINVIGLPLAFATIPGAGAPLLVYLMAAGYAAMQLSPTHICLAIVTEYFRVDMAALLRKTIPLFAVFCLILNGYYLLLLAWL